MTSPDKFSVDKVTVGGITRIKLSGILNQSFEGRKLGESIRTKKIVVDMRHVRRFASWGMSEWMEFLRLNAERDIYIVECSSYALIQLNLITSLLGHAKLVSYYASFRCATCTEELERLFIIPRDRDAIRNLPSSEQQCPTCGGKARLEEYPASFDVLADRASFDIDDEVLAYFRTQLKYDIAPDLSRFRAFRATRDGYTYLRLSGNLATLPADTLARVSSATTVVDLAAVSFEPTQLDAWHAYLGRALANVKSFQLLDCPPGFFDHAVHPDDLGEKLKIRTFAMTYQCVQCERTTDHFVDVAANLEDLTAGTAAPIACATCKSPLVAALTTEQIARMRRLPARDHDAKLDKFLAKARKLPADELENCLTTSAEDAAAPRAPAPRRVYIALALAALLAATLAGIVITLWQRAQPTSAAIGTPSKPTFTRPDWITSDSPASAYCLDLINRMMCIGVSSYRTNRADAEAEANDAALEELVNAVGLKMTDSFFRDNVAPGYSDARARALSALQTGDPDRNDAAALAKAVDDARTARKRVREILQRSGGAAAPAQRSDWYWEEYAGERGKPNEMLVFVRYDVALDAVRALVDKYSAASTVLDSRATTAFPALAWQDPHFAGGAMLIKVSPALASAGLAPSHFVVSVGGRAVADANAFVRAVEDATKSGRMSTFEVQSDGKPPRSVEVQLDAQNGQPK